MMRINLTETERKVISGDKTVRNNHKRNIHMNARRKAAKMIENLEFLAEHLPESQQKQIFSPERVSNLVDKILTYRKVPKSGGEKLPRMRGQKDHPTEKDAKKMHDEYVGIPKKLNERHKRLPRKEYNILKSWTPPERWDPSKKWIGIGGARFPHPSLRRQIDLAIKILEKTYAQILEKRDTDKIRRKMMQDFHPIIYFYCIGGEVDFWSRSGWISRMLQDSPYEDWSQKLIDDWLKKIGTQKDGTEDTELKKQLTQFLERWLIGLCKEGSKQLTNNRILILNTSKQQQTSAHRRQ